jgi:hypothetical protein
MNKMATVFMLFLGIALAAPAELTVYNQGFGVVKDVRTINTNAGDGTITVSDVAKGIEPASVKFKSTDGKVSLNEQNYVYDLASNSKLLDKYIGETITVNSGNTTYTGKLLSYADGMLLDLGLNGLVSVKDVTNIRYPVLPGGLITKPALVWNVYSSAAGTHPVEITYTTSGVDWTADYVATISGDEKTLDLDGWVTIDNNAGIPFSGVKLKLIAGQVQTVAKQSYSDQYRTYASAAYEAAPMGGGSAPSVSEQDFYEYHLYTVSTPLKIKDNQQKQIKMLSKDGVSVTKEYLYEGEQSYWRYYSEGQTNVKTVLKFTNSDANKLGIPLPAGKIKVYKPDDEGQLQFIGEDTIEHTPKDKELKITTGYAFDVKGERTVTDQQSGTRWDSETVEIKIKNSKSTEVTVTALEHLYGTWEITKTSQNYNKKDAYTIEYAIKVPANSEKTVSYTAKYTW